MMDEFNKIVLSIFDGSTYEKILALAQKKHRVFFITQDPLPTSKEKSRAERVLNQFWIVWALLGLFAGIVGVPHTLNSVLPNVDIKNETLRTIYSGVVIATVEIAILSVAVVSGLASHYHSGSKKVSSLAGIINRIFRWVGANDKFDLKHLPDKHSDGSGVVLFLLMISYLFNFTDTFRHSEMFGGYTHQIDFAVKLGVGALSPTMLLFCGHRFAQELARWLFDEDTESSEQKGWNTRLTHSWNTVGASFIEAEIYSNKEWANLYVRGLNRVQKVETAVNTIHAKAVAVMPLSMPAEPPAMVIVETPVEVEEETHPVPIHSFIEQPVNEQLNEYPEQPEQNTETMNEYSVPSVAVGKTEQIAQWILNNREKFDGMKNDTERRKVIGEALGFSIAGGTLTNARRIAGVK